MSSEHGEDGVVEKMGLDWAFDGVGLGLVRLALQENMFKLVLVFVFLYLYICVCVCSCLSVGTRWDGNETSSSGFVGREGVAFLYDIPRC